MEESSFLRSLMSAWDETDQASSDDGADTTSSAHLNSLLRVARWFLADRASPREFLEELRIVASRLETALRHVHGEPDRVDRVRDAYEEMRQSLLEMAEFFEHRDEELLREGVARMEAAAAALGELGEDFDAAPGPDQAIHCRVCGQPGQPQESACGRCGAILVRQDIPVMEGVPEEVAQAAPELLTLYSASEQAAVGAFPVDLWRTMVETELARFQSLHEQASTLMELGGENASQGLLDLGDALLGHLVEAYQAAERMLRFESDQNVERLARHWIQLLQAVNRVQRAGVYFWESAQTLAAHAQRSQPRTTAP